MDDDLDDEKDDKRRSRNLSEKKRRDQFNLLVNELSSMVSTNSRKMDKSTVLKSTIAFLKNHNEVAVRSRESEIQENWKPSFLPNEEFTHLILEALDGFIIVFSSSGKIHYVSESITSLLGHLPNDLLHSTIYDIVYEEEHQEIYNILLNPPKTAIDPSLSKISPESQICFMAHLKRGSFENPPKILYEYVQFSGYFRENSDGENSRYNSSSENNHKTLFVGTARIMTPQLIREMSIVDTKSEFTSRHSLEWKFLFLDHRAPPVIGYLPFEVLGTSGYDYYHFDDLERVVTCHEALMQKGEGTSCFYRFLTKGQQWIWLQTRFYITYHQWNSKPEFVVCTHRVVSFSDVMKHMRKNNGKISDDVDEMKTQNSDLMATSSLWSGKNAKVPKSFASQTSPIVCHKKQSSYRADSDSTSMSADSPCDSMSHHSMLTQHSSVSQRMKPKLSMTPNYQHQSHTHFPQLSLPHTQGIPSTIPILNHPTIQPIVVPPQIIPAQRRQVSFIDRSQYITTAIPVQTASYVLSPAQNQIQDHLQRKHEELQKIIIEQQNELRKVSEQLFMAQYGIIPSIVNVSVPQAVGTIDQQDANNGSRCISSSSHATHSSYHDMSGSQQMDIHNPYEVNPASFQTIQQHDDFELIPYQMNHEPQILFSSDKDSNVSKQSEI